MIFCILGCRVPVLHLFNLFLDLNKKFYLQHPPLPLGAVPDSQVLWQALPKPEESLTHPPNSYSL